MMQSLGTYNRSSPECTVESDGLSGWVYQVVAIRHPCADDSWPRSEPESGIELTAILKTRTGKRTGCGASIAR